jgi:hypothetical protein
MGTPAAVRGRYIREFSDEEDSISANWQAVFINQGQETKTVRLDRFHAGPVDQAAGRRISARRDDTGGN